MQPYFHSREKVIQYLSILKLLTANNNNNYEQTKIDSLSLLLSKRYDLLAEVLSSHESLYVNKQLIQKLLIGKSLMDKIRFIVNDVMLKETQLLKDQETKHKGVINLSPIAFLLVAFFSLSIFVLAFFKIRRDVSDLKKINNQLLITQESFQHAEQIAQISYWWWNVNTNKLYYSNNQYRLLGVEPNSFEPTVEKYLEFVHPEDKHIITEGGKKVIESATPSVVHCLSVLNRTVFLQEFYLLNIVQ